MSSLLEAVENSIKQEADLVTVLNWSLKRIYGGMNGIIYRADNARNPLRPLVVKIRKRDERQRALREFSALQVLHSLSEAPAPEPISLHTAIPSLPGDVVISRWVEGQVLDDLSEVSFDLWERILSSLARCHQLTPVHAPHLMDAVLPIRSMTDVVADIERRYTKLPDGPIGELTKADIGSLFDEFKQVALKDNSSAQYVSLIVCDTNPSNMIDSEGRVIIVDWENAGWGDPAFDIADLLVRPNCAGLSNEMRGKIIMLYTEMMGMPQLAPRILAYERLMLIFWLILTSNGLAGNDTARLPGVRQFTQQHMQRQQMAYIRRIEAARAE